jgi:hypothetical protein
MAKVKSSIRVFTKKVTKKRSGVHSKNASKGQSGYKKQYRGQGR